MSNLHNAMDINLDEVTILEKPAMFTCLRIDRDSIPQGYHAYDVRHDDDCQGDAVQIARFILVNHWGTLITRDEIKFHNGRYLNIEPDDLNYSAGNCRTMKEFMGKYPPISKPPKSHER